VIGPLLRDHDARCGLRKQLDNLPNMLSESLPSIGSPFGDLFWTLSLTVALLIDGPRIVSELRRRLPVRYRR
jgi:predicted PurR-regulated permease PerM